MSASERARRDGSRRRICGCPARSPRSWPVLPDPRSVRFSTWTGRLVAGFTAVILTQERLRRRDMGVGELLSMVQAGLNHTLGRIEFEDLIGKACVGAARAPAERLGGDRRAAVRPADRVPDLSGNA